MTPRPTTLTFTPWAVLYPTTTTPADVGANPRTGLGGKRARPSEGSARRRARLEAALRRLPTSHALPETVHPI